MTTESFCALCDLAACLEFSRQITRLRREGAREGGWIDMTGCGILSKDDIAALQAVLERREAEDRKRLDACARNFVKVFLANDMNIEFEELS